MKIIPVVTIASTCIGIGLAVVDYIIHGHKPVCPRCGKRNHVKSLKHWRIYVPSSGQILDHEIQFFECEDCKHTFDIIK